ncbi:S8 family serine peptidase [Dongia deserti]|uniref:S8 family serine peptidase n=1 Tax=Dongia deserti TaxID=2268030 RepID=UPI0013C4EDC6|nr:S8 family serine peptidase [Dongia deserti]
MTAVAFAALPAAASQVGDDGSDRILIADPSPALRSYLLSGGFIVESTERLEALDFSLVIVALPKHTAAVVALNDLQAHFPTAVLALDDSFYLAQDARLLHGPLAQPGQVLAAIGWRSDDGDVGKPIRVGMIDSSLDPAHQALRGAAIVPRTFTSGKAPAADTAHGTAIAAMLVGRSNDRSVVGLVRGTTLLHASIFQNSRQGPKASSADFLRAVDWMLKSGVRIINASITSPTKNAVVLYALSTLSREEAVVVAAAGNHGPSGPPVYPAAIESAFAVTAVSIDGNAYPHANTGDYIDISAPGVDLTTTSPRITSGTSLAVPFVTAAIARMVQRCGVSPPAATARLQANARDLGPRGRDSHFGWGLLQAPRCSPTATQLSDRRHPRSVPAD